MTWKNRLILSALALAPILAGVVVVCESRALQAAPKRDTLKQEGSVRQIQVSDLDPEEKEHATLRLSYPGDMNVWIYRADWSGMVKNTIGDLKPNGRLFHEIATDARHGNVLESLGVGSRTLTCERDPAPDVLVIQFSKPITSFTCTVTAYPADLENPDHIQYAMFNFAEDGRWIGGDIPVDDFSYLVWHQPPELGEPFPPSVPCKFLILSAWGNPTGNSWDGPTSDNVITVDQIKFRYHVEVEEE